MLDGQLGVLPLSAFLFMVLLIFSPVGSLEFKQLVPDWF